MAEAATITRETVYELDMKTVVADAVVEALDTIEERRTQQEEAARYEKIELARWAVEQAVAAHSTTPVISNITTLADQIITYIETKGQ
jgi:hypothetical protein